MADLLRISILGSMPGGEVWSVNPIFGLGGDFGGVTVSQDQCIAIATAINGITVPAGVLAMNVSGTAITGVRVEARTRAGLLEALAEQFRATPVTGTSSAAHTFQTAMVSSLRTATPGARGRGRLFWPATGIAISSTLLRPNAAAVSAALAGVKAYLASIETAVEGTFPTGVGLVVWSRASSALRAVNSIQMGDILDVQRRRRDTLTEVITATSWP